MVVEPGIYSIVTNGTKGAATIHQCRDGCVHLHAEPERERRRPVATNGALSAIAGVPKSGSLVASDVDSPNLAYSIVANGTKGTAVVTNSATGAFTYTAAVGASGADSFTFRANDGSANSNVATIGVAIAPSLPVALNGTLSLVEDGTGFGRLQATDASGNPLTFSIVANGTKGTATIRNARNGDYKYVPRQDANGADSFTFKVNNTLADSNVATITITISPDGALPRAADSTLTTTMNTPISGQMQATDAEGHILSYLVDRGARHGLVFVPSNSTNPAFTYTPDLGFK
jgi:hypothetical protein